jgi:hypothetical protein
MATRKWVEKLNKADFAQLEKIDQELQNLALNLDAGCSVGVDYAFDATMIGKDFRPRFEISFVALDEQEAREIIAAGAEMEKRRDARTRARLAASAKAGK